MAGLERGEALTFGEMVISKSGVETADRLIPWGTLTEVRVNDGIIQFKQTGKFFELSRRSLFQVPNLPLFFMLVDTFRPGAVQG